ncbi:MAG: FHA domain-containing protein [Nitrospirae bacterium]|nr:FHA domain-containing protein [Nitrospirota bacterium]
MRACLSTDGGEIVLLGSRTTIGRSGENEIQIIDERGSKQHARILKEDDGRFVILDLSSRNGTFVGNERIRKHSLRVGDTFRIAGHTFTYEERDANDPVLQDPSVSIKLLSGPAKEGTLSVEQPLPSKLNLPERNGGKA